MVCIAGPTAVGKTAVAIQLARHFSCSIISADSRQCYRELKIGVARPSMEELAEVPHHFIASHSILDDINAAWYENWALEKAADLFRMNDMVIVCGGTGLYLRALLHGMDEMPATDPVIRLRIQNDFQEKGMPWLMSEVQLKDPLFAAEGEMQNPQRMMRALEVMEQSGRSVISYRSSVAKPRDFDIIKIGLELPREELRERIAVRVRKMFNDGLVEEVKSLVTFRNMNALQTVGYSEIFEYLDGKITLEEAEQQIIHHTRQYAKRQMTWFRKEEEVKWFGPGDVDAMKEDILKVFTT